MLAAAITKHYGFDGWLVNLESGWGSESTSTQKVVCVIATSAILRDCYAVQLGGVCLVSFVCVY